MASVDYDNLINRLDEFIRKYYKNQMIRGSIYAIALILGSYLLVTFLEYFGKFGIAVRTILFWLFVFSAASILVRFFCIPLFKMLRFGKRISYDQAAQIIGTHFPNVEDKLLNTLQLQRQAGSGADEKSLLMASINQKLSELKPVPFSSAIDLGQNRKYLKWALPPFAIILILLFAAPSILTKPTERLIKHGQIINEEAPFRLQLLNENLVVPENSDFTLELKVEGKEIPDRVYLVMNGQQYLLQQESPLQFNYTFKNIQKNITFGFYASGFGFGDYEISVMPAPNSLTSTSHSTIRRTSNV